MIKKAATILIFTFFILASPASAFAATLGLSPSTGTFNKGCNVTVSVELDTTSTATDGTDAIIKFDPTKLKANSITPGTIYPDYPGSNIDSATGKITISGLASVQQAYTGKGTLATIDFTVLSTATTGVTPVTFEFDPANPTKTTDSNVVARGATPTDVLTSVTDGNYTVGTGTCVSQGSGTTTTTSTGSGTTVTTKGGLLPEAGTEELTATIAILGGVMIVFGILGFSLL